MWMCALEFLGDRVSGWPLCEMECFVPIDHCSDLAGLFMTRYCTFINLIYRTFVISVAMGHHIPALADSH